MKVPKTRLLALSPYIGPANEALSKVVPLLLLAGLAAAVATGCGDQNGGFAGVDPPQMRVTPREVAFNQIALGENEAQIVAIENLGGSELVLSEWRWSGSADDFYVEGLTGLIVSAHDTAHFSITYAPSDEAVDDAVLDLLSNGGNASVVVTSLGQVAALRTEPTEVQLLSEEVGLTVAQNVRIFNTGTEPYELGAASLITGSPDFRMVALDFDVPAQIGVQDTVTVQILYTPSGSGSDEANLLLEHDAANAISGGTVVPVLGALRSPQLVVEPRFVELGSVPMDETRFETATLTNAGQVALAIYDLYMSFDSSDDVSLVSLNEVPFVPDAFEQIDLEPGESAVLEVAYTPTDGEPDSATAVIFSNDPDFPIFELPMGGRLAGPHLTVTPRALGFGSVASGLSRELGVVIRNAGTDTLDLEPLQLTSDGSYTLANGHLMPDSLAPDEGFELLVSFSPLSQGALLGELTVSASNDPLHSPVVVTLQGHGAGTPTCELNVIPETINFGLVPRGSSRTARAAIHNVGSGECQINRVAMSSPAGGLGGILFDDLFSDAFSLVSINIPLGSRLGPGDHFLVEAAYAPVSFTAFSESELGDTGSVDITAINPVDGQEVECGSAALFSFASFARTCGINLQGRSGVADLAAIPAEVDFGLVTRGCNSQDITINIYNIGSAPVTITDIALESCTPEYTLTGVPSEISGSAGLEVPAGSPPVPIHVRYSPAGLFRSSCDVVISSNAESGGRLVVPLTGEGTDQREQTDHFVQVSGREVDVLFVVDNSGSMSEEQTNLSANFSRFIDAARLWDSDYQVGVVTTEADESFAGRAPGELVGTPRILTGDMPNLESAFAANANVGDAGDGARESGLEAAWLALTDPHLSDVGECGAECVAPYSCVANARGTESRCGGYNRSFVRENASFEIVFLSDEEDQSRGTVEFYIDFFGSIKGARNRALFHASAIVGPRGGCEGVGGAAESGSRYLDVAEATDGVTGSICDENFATSLANIGNRAFGLRVQFFLSRIAEPASVRVTDSGGREIGGWTFDEESNSVVFTEDTTPRPGTEFDVSYTARCF